MGVSRANPGPRRLSATDAVQITLPDLWAPSYDEAGGLFAGMAATAP